MALGTRPGLRYFYPNVKSICPVVKIRLRVLLAFLAGFFPISCSSAAEEEIVPEGLVVNELYAASGDDWIESYNSQESPRDLSGFLIYDNIIRTPNT